MTQQHSDPRQAEPRETPTVCSAASNGDEAELIFWEARSPADEHETWIKIDTDSVVGIWQ